MNIALNIYTITNLLFLTTHIPHITNTSISIPLETWIRAPAYIFWRTDPFLCHTSLTFALCCAQRHLSFILLSIPFISPPITLYRTFSGSITRWYKTASCLSPLSRFKFSFYQIQIFLCSNTFTLTWGYSVQTHF